jgi:uncharacterized protein (PEP-CTERM system associated)
MAIDPRRFRRGRDHQFFLRSRVVILAATALVGQAASRGAHAQLIADPVGAYGGGWKFTPALEVDETWSDNINLSPAGSERSDFVTSVSPQLRLSRNGPRLNLAFDYTPQFLYYAKGTNGSTVRNSLDAVAHVSLIENLLSFDTTALVSQQNISPFGTQAANSVNGSNNRAEQRSFSAGPTLQSHLDRDLTYSAGYHYSWSDSDSALFASSHTTDLFANFQSSTSFRDLGIGGNFDRSEQGFGNSSRIVTEAYSGTLTYVVQPTIHVHGSAGYDRDSYPTTGQPDFSGLSYSGGVDWDPTRHTHLTATFGHRYFGPTANVSLGETTSKLALNATYSRDQTTSTGSGLTPVESPAYALIDQFYQATIPDPAARAIAVAQALQQAGLPTQQYGTSTFISNQLFVQRRADISLALFGLRNNVTFDVSRTESQSLSNVAVGFDIFNQSQKFRSTVYSANWSHKLGPRTTANATLEKVRSQAIQGVGDTSQRIFTVSLNRQFQPHLSGNVLYRNTIQTSDNGGTGFFSGNYRENAVLGSLRLTF